MATIGSSVGPGGDAGAVIDPTVHPGTRTDSQTLRASASTRSLLRKPLLAPVLSGQWGWAGTEKSISTLQVSGEPSEVVTNWAVQMRTSSRQSDRFSVGEASGRPSTLQTFLG